MTIVETLRRRLAQLRALLPVEVEEAGRVLSATNEAKVRAAIESLEAVLASLGGLPDDGDDEPAKEALRLAAQEARAMLRRGESQSATRALIDQALREKLAPNREDPWPWVEDFYGDDVVVYRQDGRLYQAAYTVDRTSGSPQVLLGDPAEVEMCYVPVGESARPTIEAWLYERAFTADQRKGLAKRGDALPDGSFPIANVSDLRNAVHAFGRAKDKAAAKAHIIKRAKALGATDELPEDWDGSTKGKTKESSTLDVAGDYIPLLERAVRRDDTVRLKLIQPGRGSSGYYTEEALKTDGPKVFTRGLKMFWDHPTPAEEAERPERSLRDLAGELVSDARFEASGPKGPGLYADAKVFPAFKESVEALAPHIGVSIRASGRGQRNAVGPDGVTGPIIEGFVGARSVDYVTAPGAGGEVLQLFEAARGGQRPPGAPPTHPSQGKETTNVDPQEAQALREANAAAVQRIEAVEAENRRLREAMVLREAREFAATRLAAIEMPAPTRARLLDQLAKNPPLKDGALDAEAFATQITEAATAEIEYLARATGSGSGRITGMGGAAGAGLGGAAQLDDAQLTEAFTQSFTRIGLDAKTAALAAQGRR